MSAAKKQKKTTTNSEDGVANGAPQAMFYSNPYPLDPTRHATAGLKKNVGYHFAKGVNSILINMDEIPEAARSYPIVLTGDKEEPRPIAVMGLEEDNQFVDAAGEWDPQAYIPAYVRRYPFGLANVPNSDEMLLCVDEEAPHFAQEAPEIPFFEGEKQSELVQEALKFCGAYQQQWNETGKFGRALAEADLVVQRSLQAKQADGSSKAIKGFQTIDAEKWHNYALNHANEWQQKYYLPLVVLMLASQVNWKYLAIRKK